MQIQNEMTLDIAEAPSRKTKVWQNHKIQWSELLDKMSRPVRTNETMAQYRAMSKDDQSASKDVGGFVGGYCINGSRTNIRFRSVLCLDADYADNDLWDDWIFSYGAAAAMYSTRKHTPDKPRYRLVIPLARDVSPEEYPAIGRKVASVLGIDKFDDTTYSPSRLMYYPSVSSDAEFKFEYFDSPALDPDEVLSTYVDWHDMSSWPMSSRVTEVVRKTTSSKQEDPLTKPGIVGAFCRSYSIEEAIAEFVPQYTPCGEGRYTYVDGSTAGGVTTYDGKFSYSFHATDPTSGQLCNAFDLVRIFTFGSEDDGLEKAKMTERPSYKRMVDLVTKDPKVKQVVHAESMASAMDDFSTPLEDDDWTKRIEYDKNLVAKSTIQNAELILEHDPLLAGRLYYNEFEQNIIWRGKAPWDRNSGSAWNDSDDSALRAYLEKVYKLSGKEKIFDAVNVVAGKNHIHPVREYLDSCDWDGTPRLDTLLIDYLGADDTEYTRSVTRKSLTAAVARIYEPGCKFDYMLTIRGKQGIGKSAIIRKLGGRWYSDSFSTVQGKDAYEQVLGAWIMEIGELAGMKKAEAETIKLFISKQIDRFRPAYGRRTQEFPRQCVFIGTTNETQFLRDATGNRRFWVVDTPNAALKDLWEDLTQAEIDQIWGEAIYRYNSGEALYLSREMEAVAREVQSEYEEENPKEGIIAAYLERLLPEGWEAMSSYDRRRWLEDNDNAGTIERTSVSNYELWIEALGYSPDKAMDRYAVAEISGIMTRMPGWERAKGLKTINPYGRQRYYQRCSG